jgi:uncharacterized protein YcfJ
MRTFPRLALLPLCTVSLLAQAAEYDDTARVLNVAERLERINQPRQECATQESAAAPAERGVLGAVIGGVAGALVGSQVGQGNGRIAAAAVGAAGGAIVGDRVQNNGSGMNGQPAPSCRTVDNWVTRPSGYAVTYEYRGNTYTDTVPFNPGTALHVRVQLNPQY